jgi:hypothetical protein
MHLAAYTVLWLAAMVALSLSGLGGGAARAQTPTATATPTATPTRTPGPVGGIAQLPPLAGASAEGAGAPAGDSGWSAGGYAALVGVVVVALGALGTGAVLVRRRSLR